MPGFDMSKLGVRTGKNGEDRYFLLPDFRASGYYSSGNEEIEQRDYRVEIGSVEHRINKNTRYAKEETDEGEIGSFSTLWQAVSISEQEKARQKATQEPHDSFFHLADAFIAKGGLIRTLSSGVGLAYAQGRRSEMEDEHIATVLELSVGGETKNIPVQAVFDGHGGDMYARFAHKYYAQVLKKRLEECNPEKLTDTGIYNAVSLAAADMHRLPSIYESGTTANVSLIVDNTIYIANTGDSRAILVTENDCIQLSEDAKPSSKRFQPAMVNRDPEAVKKIGKGRLEGRLAIARTWGDRKHNGIDPRPKVTKYVMTEEERKNARLVQTCDGAYEFRENGVLKGMASRVLGDAVRQSAISGDSAAYTASKALAAAYHAKSHDNISIMITPLDKMEVDSTALPSIPEELQNFLKDTKEFFDKSHQQGLIDDKLDLKFKYAVSFSALLGDAETLNSLIGIRFDPAWCNKQHDSLLMMAARNGHAAAMNILIEKDVPIDLANDRGETALMLAIKGAHTHAVKLLVEAGADIGLKDKEGKSCMEMAVETGDPAMLKLLAESEKGTDMLAGDKDGVLTWSAILGGHIDILKLLIEKNAAHLDAPRDGENGETPLCEIMKTDRTDIAELMIKNGANVRVKNMENQSLAVVAAIHGQEGMLKLLGGKGYKIVNNGRSLLAHAAKHGRSKVVKFLIDRKVDVNAADGKDKTALMHAAMAGQTHVIQLLADHGANISATTNDTHKSALKFATQNKHAQAQRLLEELLRNEETGSVA